MRNVLADAVGVDGEERKAMAPVNHDNCWVMAMRKRCWRERTACRENADSLPSIQLSSCEGSRVLLTC